VLREPSCRESPELKTCHGHNRETNPGQFPSSGGEHLQHPRKKKRGRQRDIHKLGKRKAKPFVGNVVSGDYEEVIRVNVLRSSMPGITLLLDEKTGT